MRHTDEMVGHMGNSLSKYLYKRNVQFQNDADFVIYPKILREMTESENVHGKLSWMCDFAKKKKKEGPMMEVKKKPNQRSPSQSPKSLLIIWNRPRKTHVYSWHNTKTYTFHVIKVDRWQNPNGGQTTCYNIICVCVCVWIYELDFEQHFIFI